VVVAVSVTRGTVNPFNDVEPGKLAILAASLTE
jgi:hypothetical protein